MECYAVLRYLEIGIYSCYEWYQVQQYLHSANYQAYQFLVPLMVHVLENWVREVNRSMSLLKMQ